MRNLPQGNPRAAGVLVSAEPSAGQSARILSAPHNSPHVRPVIPIVNQIQTHTLHRTSERIQSDSVLQQRAKLTATDLRARWPSTTGTPLP